MKIEELFRKRGISGATYYNWKSKFDGMDASNVKRLRELEEENNRLKKIFADLSFENEAMKELFKKGLATDKRRDTAQFFKGIGLSILKACHLANLSRASFYRELKDWREADADVIDAINAELKKSSQAGFWRIFGCMKRNGNPFSHSVFIGFIKPRV